MIRPSRRLVWQWSALGATILAAVVHGSIAFSSNCQSDSTRGLSFPEGQEIDLGIVIAGEQHFDVPVVNESAIPVMIDGVTASCGCLDAKVEPSAILPRQPATLSGRLVVQPDDKKVVVVIIRFRESRSRTATVVIRFRGTSQGTLVAESNGIELRDVIPGRPSTATCEVQYRPSGDGGPVAAGSLTGRVFPEKLRGVVAIADESSEDEKRWRVSVTVARAEPHAIRGEIHLTLGQPAIATLKVPLLVTGSRVLTLIPQQCVADIRSDTPFPQRLHDITAEAADGWVIEGVASPQWLSCRVAQVAQARAVLELSAVSVAPKRRGVDQVMVRLRNSTGASEVFPLAVAYEVQ